MFTHEYPFDPTYGYSLDDLLRVPAPLEPTDFVAFWTARYERARAHRPKLSLGEPETLADGRLRYPHSFESTEGWTIHGWLVAPADGVVERGIVRLPGYGGMETPSAESLSVPKTAVLHVGPRGRPPSMAPNGPQTGAEHVVWEIEDRDKYIIGGCVDDAWLGVTALINQYPQVEGHIGLMGGSFGGGLGAMALAWDKRLQRGSLEVPTFGNQPLRLRLPCNGSGENVRKYFAKTGKIPAALAYYDAASAARHISVPMNCCCALFDPAVAPPGQFAVYNAIPGEKQLFVKSAGHFRYEAEAAEVTERTAQLVPFFEKM